MLTTSEESSEMTGVLEMDRPRNDVLGCLDGEGRGYLVWSVTLSRNRVDLGTSAESLGHQSKCDNQPAKQLNKKTGPIEHHSVIVGYLAHETAN